MTPAISKPAVALSIQIRVAMIIATNGFEARRPERIAMAMSRRRTGQRNPPHKTAGLIVCVAAAVALAFIWFQFRGELTAKDQLVLISARAGLSMDPGAKVTYNGVQIGRVGEVEEFSVGG